MDERRKRIVEEQRRKVASEPSILHREVYKEYRARGNIPKFISDARRRGRMAARQGYIEKVVKVDSLKEMPEYRKAMVDNSPKSQYANAFFFGFWEEQTNIEIEKGLIEKGENNYTGNVLKEKY